MQSYIETLSGNHIEIYNPKPEDFNIEDIASGLSNSTRFGGQIHNFYSVAEHSIKVAINLPPELQLQGLFHDASEAYLNDVVSPLKYALDEYRLIEGLWMKAIMEKFRIAWPLSPKVKEMDSKLYEWERDHIKRTKLYSGWMPFMARAKFLHYYDKYTKDREQRALALADATIATP